MLASLIHTDQRGFRFLIIRNYLSLVSIHKIRVLSHHFLLELSKSVVSLIVVLIRNLVLLDLREIIKVLEQAIWI